MKPIVIAGNGPSLAQIDYSRLPQDFDVFRCNQFYFEDKYFLGKKIKGVFFNPSVLKEQIFTLHHIENKGEYEVEDIYCNREDDEILSINNKKIETIFPYVKNTYFFLKKLQDFNKLDKFYRFYFRKWPTTGIVMLYTAIAQGYKEIYLTGIDFYKGGGADYAFKINCKSILTKKVPSFCNKKFQSLCHDRKIDCHFLDLALSIPEIKIYALSPSTDLCEVLPLAPIQNHIQFEVKDKPKDYIHDLIQPPCHSFNQKLKDYGISNKNIYVKVILDLIHLCKAIFFALKN